MRITFFSQAQGTFISISKTQFSLDTVDYVGFTSYFEYPSQQVLRAFWAYTKAFAHAENRRSYYLVTVPPQTDSSNVSITLVGKPDGEGSTCQFALGMDQKQIAQDLKSYERQLKIMLLEFKVDMYMGIYQEQINELGKEARQLSNQHQKALKKGEIYLQENAQRLSQLKDLEQQISKIRIQQVELLAILQKAKG